MSAVYKWKGIEGANSDEGGKGVKYTEGKVKALNRDEAAYKLKEQNIIITSLVKISGKEESGDGDGSSGRSLFGRKKIPVEEVIVFTKKLETMVRAGLPMLDTIKMLEEQTSNSALREIVKRIYLDVEAGASLSDSFSVHSNAFDNIYINLLRAGESSGKIDLFLSKLVIGMEKNQKIRSSIKGALTYPIILLLVAIAVIVLMMIYVVPVFQEMFSGMEGGLPAMTQAVVNISEFLRDPLRGGVLAGILIGTGFLLSIAVKRNYKLNKAWDRMVLRTPLFGDMIQKSALSKIAMIVGNLTSAGVPVLESLDIASTSAGNIAIREAMTEVKRGVYSGEPLSELFQKNPNIFTPTFSAMVSVGERTGNMEEMYDSIATYYEEELDSTVQQLTSMLEPIMIVFMGLTIGFILVAMYSPMFMMGKTM